MIEILIIGFIFGLALGSFANVCIWRIPKNQSIIFPFSYCPSCNKSLKWYDNIPIVSYIVLGGKCRYCKKKISFIYPMVEFLSGILQSIIFLRYWDSPILLTIGSVLILILLVVSVIDFLYMIVPQETIYILFLIGLFSLILNKKLGETLFYRILNSSCGFLSGIILSTSTAILGKKIFKKDALGGGDIKIFTTLGLTFGVRDLIGIFFLSSLIGSIFGIFLMIFKKIRFLQHIPFVPFISIATFIIFLFSDLLKNLVKLFYGF